MRFLAHAFYLGIKELKALRRDPVLLLFVVYLFTVTIYMTGVGMTFDLKGGALAIADEDRSQFSERLWQSFREPFFHPPTPIALSDIDRALDRGRETFVLDIPPHFERDLAAGRHPKLQLNVDATAISQAFIGAAYIQTIVTEEVNRYLSGTKTGAPPSIGLRMRVKYNPNRESPWFVSLVELMMATTVISIFLPATALLREREHGTIEHLLVMPLSPAEIMFAKVWSSSFVVLIGVTIALVFIVRGIFHTPVNGSLTLFYVAVLVYQIATSGLGMMLATVARTMPQMALLLLLIVAPMVFLSGAWTPPEAMPPGMQWLMYASPLKYLVEIGAGIFFRGAGLDVLWPQFLAMASVGAVTFVLALLRFRARFSAVRL